MQMTDACADRELLVKLWTVCEQLLHTDEYKRSYSTWLAEVLLGDEDHHQRIIDTAAGVGFPAAQLLQAGFDQLWCSDADPDLLRSLIDEIGDRGPTPPVLCLRWQELAGVVMQQFDTVLCLDASIGFMDSWGSSTMVTGPDEICARVRTVLENFHAITGPGGRFLVGLQKNNNRTNTDRFVMEVGTAELEGHPATAVWDMRYDWSSRRKTWVNRVEHRGSTFEQTRHSYLFDKHELMGFLQDVGFEDAREVPTPDFFYEDVIVAHRAGR